jgi:hypothetical protein
LVIEFCEFKQTVKPSHIKWAINKTFLKLKANYVFATLKKLRWNKRKVQLILDIKNALQMYFFYFVCVKFREARNKTSKQRERRKKDWERK